MADEKDRLAQAWDDGIEVATRVFVINADEVLPLLREYVLPPNPYRVFPPGETTKTPPPTEITSGERGVL